MQRNHDRWKYRNAATHVTLNGSVEQRFWRLGQDHLKGGYRKDKPVVGVSCMGCCHKNRRKGGLRFITHRSLRNQFCRKPDITSVEEESPSQHHGTD